jgi:hypothetical protein
MLVSMGINWLITMGRQNQPWVLGTLIYEGVKKEGEDRFFSFFLPLHHPNNHFENISIFYLPCFNSVAKKNCL